MIALVLRFFPASDATGQPVTLAAESAKSESAGDVERAPAGPRKLQPPGSGSRTRPKVPGVKESARPATPSVKVKTPTIGSGLSATATLRDVPALAGALLHRDPDGFREFLKGSNLGLSENRKRLLIAFSVAISGNASGAVAIAGDLVPGDGVGETEFSYLKSAVDGSWARARAASAARAGAIEYAMELALLAREGKRLLDRREWRLAAETLSQVLLEDVGAPWASDWSFSETWGNRLNAAQEHYRWNPKGSWPSVTEEVKSGDSLSLIRSRVVKQVPGLLMCTGLINRVNGVGDRYLQPGEQLRIPTELVSTLVDLEARHVFFMFGDEIGAVWPAAIGAPGHETPEGEYKVGVLTPEPPWFRPGEAMIPYGDPDNQLGTRWVGWNENGGNATHYGFHGTWEPETIGNAVSDGCIRLRNEDVEELYLVIPRGSAVKVQM
ncbi:MAG: hypothetical protein ACI87A_000310 [Planctomycetota bacterium]